MSCGCPVIASNIPPVKEIINNSQITVKPTDINEIANGIVKYIENQDFRNKMIKE
jgi:glycosyltransferase involved in cell wall biosynthesis